MPELTTIGTIVAILVSLAVGVASVYGIRHRASIEQIQEVRLQFQDVRQQVIDLRKEVLECHEDRDRIRAELAVSRRDADRLRLEIGDMHRMILRLETRTLPAVIVVDQASIIREWSPEATTLFHWQADEMLGQSFERIVPQRLRALHAAAFAEALKRKVRSEPLDTAAVARYGLEFAVTIKLHEYAVKGEKLIMAEIYRRVD